MTTLTIWCRIDDSAIQQQGEAVSFTNFQSIICYLDMGDQLRVVTISGCSVEEFIPDAHDEDLWYVPKRYVEMSQSMPLSDVATWRLMKSNGTNFHAYNGLAQVWAVENGCIDVLKYLLQEEHCIIYPENRNLLYIAYRELHFPIVEYLETLGVNILLVPAKKKNRLYRHLMDKDRFDLALRLINQGLRMPKLLEVTLIMAVSRLTNDIMHEILSYMSENPGFYRKKMKAILDTALHITIQTKNIAGAEILMNYGASVADSAQMLFCIALSDHSVECIDFLIRYGAHLSLSPLEYHQLIARAKHYVDCLPELSNVTSIDSTADSNTNSLTQLLKCSQKNYETLQAFMPPRPIPLDISLVEIDCE